jgi:hypothetical protein
MSDSGLVWLLDVQATRYYFLALQMIKRSDAETASEYWGTFLFYLP